MPIAFSCRCGERYLVEDSLAGRRSRCKFCGVEIHLPKSRKQATANGPLAAQTSGAASANETARWGEPVTGPASTEELIELLELESAELASRGAERMDLAGVGVGPGRGRSGTVASLPVGLWVDWTKYTRSFPKVPLGLLLGFLILPGAALVISPLLWMAWVALLVVAPFWLFYVHQKFSSGDLTPGIVVARDPWRVAVYTDLGNALSGTSHPAVKIIEQPLDHMTGGPPRVGQVVAAASHYRGSPQRSHWDTFYPTVLNCAVADADAVEHALHRIPEELWRRLSQSLDVLQTNLPGIYTLWDDNRAGRDFARRRRMLRVGTALALIVMVAALQGLTDFMRPRRGGNRPPAMVGAMPPPGWRAPGPMQGFGPAPPRPAWPWPGRRMPLGHGMPPGRGLGRPGIAVGEGLPGDAARRNDRAIGVPGALGGRAAQGDQVANADAAHPDGGQRDIAPGDIVPGNNSVPGNNIVPGEVPLDEPERVEVRWHGEWVSAAILDEQQGRFLVHIDDPPGTVFWVTRGRIRPLDTMPERP